MNTGTSSVTKIAGAAEFKAKYVRLINDAHKDGEYATIAKRGRTMVVHVSAPQADDQPSIVGALRGSVLACGEPFLPAVDPAD